ncbi:odorant-binding protein 2b-like [Ovis aries]|uniref:Uncharacterized protein n=2 Tax=Ovis TaxID=9935 RepID=A0AC11BQ78_SHEEP|nr:odorant-binding protein 2b-like [Ovis aries]
MKALLLPIALSLLAALRAQDPPSCPLEPQKIAGTWYVKAIVTDGDLPKETRSRKVSPVTVTALGGGDLELSFTFRKEARCHEKTARMQPTGEPGKYSSNGGKKHMYILELPVEGHCVLYCEGQRQGKPVRVGKLIGRNPDVNPEALEAFKKFAQRKGLSLEDIFTPEQTESCKPESD